jgi:murein DD-endopeptidase MepM/ murein hydrolase activator NlpD
MVLRSTILAAALAVGTLAAAAPARSPERVDESAVHAHPAPREPRGLEAFPVEGPVGYGEAAARFGASRVGHVHEGQDLFAPAGTPLLAVSDGVVLEKGNGGGRGNYIAIYSPGAGETYVYLHMQRPSPRAAGEWVRAGERVGRLGCTGSCFGDHLHLERRVGRGLEARPIDPLPLLRHLSRSG